MKPTIPLPRRYVTALVMSVFAPAAAAVADPPLVVDGKDETIPSGSYETTAESHVGLRVKNGGRATGNQVDITTAGKNAYAVDVTQPLSWVSLANGTLHTKGSGAYGVLLVGGGSAILHNVTILTEGGSARGAHFDRAGSKGEFRGSRIETSGYAATGISAENGGGFSLEEGAEV